MKVGMVTMPQHTNYGGILQAYALKTVIESLGHEVTVFDQKDKTWFPKWWKAPLIYMKRGLLRTLKGSKGPEVFREYRLRREFPVVSSRLTPFVKEKLAPRVLTGYNEIKEGEYDAFVVGSDQVLGQLLGVHAFLEADVLDELILAGDHIGRGVHTLSEQAVASNNQTNHFYLSS